ELRFHDAFSEIFERRMRGESDLPQPSQPKGGELSLVDDAEIGERLAIDRLVQRSRSKLDPDEVLGVRARLGALVERDWFDEKGHPASPEAVFEALRRTLDQLKANSDVRDALLHALEPHVSANLNDIYSGVNERLRSGQILPSIRARIVNAPDTRVGLHADSGNVPSARSDGHGNATGEPADGRPGGPDTFGGVGNAGGSGGPGAAGGPGRPGGQGGPAGPWAEGQGPMTGGQGVGGGHGATAGAFGAAGAGGA